MNIQGICRPVYVYAAVAFIIAILALITGIFLSGIANGVASFIANVIWIIICSIILWLICKFSVTAAWIITLLIILLNLLAIAGFYARTIIF